MPIAGLSPGRNPPLKKKKRKKSSGGPLVAAAVLITTAAAVFFLMPRTSSTSTQSCDHAVARLTEMEAADISETESLLRDLKEQDRQVSLSQTREELMHSKDSVLSEVEIRQAFQGTVIIGDSITESIMEYGYLDKDVVVSKRGLSIADADSQIATAIGLNPSVIFMAFGSNDLSMFFEDSAAFIDAYRTQVRKLQEALPDVPVYINGILPILPSRIELEPELRYYPQYNEALEAFCSEEGLTYIDNAFIVENDASIYEPDGEHVTSSYYPIWLTYMAEIAGL